LLFIILFQPISYLSPSLHKKSQKVFWNRLMGAFWMPELWHVEIPFCWTEPHKTPENGVFVFCALAVFCAFGVCLELPVYY
jgi:hypothetical protein